MFNNLLQSCGKANRIQKIRPVQRRFFASKKKGPNWVKPVNDPIDSDMTNVSQSETPFINMKDINLKDCFDQNPTYTQKSGISFADLFQKDCNINEIKEILEAVEYLLKASEGDMAKIRRFYVTVMVLAIHAPSLDPKVKFALRKYFQLTDETTWRQNPFLRLCEAYSQVQNDPLAKFSVAFRIDQPKLRAILTLKNYLAEATRVGIPDLEPWDLQMAKSRVEKVWPLINSPKGKLHSSLESNE